MTNFRTMDLNLLRVLDAILREGSTVAAARRLGLSQPAVSSALGRLRNTLGEELFIRRGQGLEPTDHARALTQPLQQALSDLEELLSNDDTFDPLTANRVFRLSGSDFFGELLMPGLIDMLSREAPNIRLQLITLPENYDREFFEKQRVDILLAPSTRHFDGADSAPLMSAPFAVIARSGHPQLKAASLSPGAMIPLDLFCSLDHVLFSPASDMRGMTDIALERVGRTRRIAMTVPYFSGVYRAVARSDLIGLIPLSLARHVAEDVGLSLYRPPVDVTRVDLSMSWLRRSTGSQAHRWLRSRIAQVLEPFDDPEAEAGGASA